MVAPALARVLRFGTVGTLGALVNVVLLWLLVDGTGMHYLPAALLAIETSIISNFLLNRAWTWRDRHTGWATLVTYHWVTAFGTIIQFGVLIAAVEALGIHYLLASLLGVAAGAVANFLGNDRLTFRPAVPEAAHHAKRIAMYGAALAVMVGAALLFQHPWDGFVMQETVDDWIHEGRSPYETAEDMPSHAYRGWSPPATAQWFAYPPVALFALMLTAGPVVAAEGPVWAVRLAAKIPAIVGVLACAWLARKVAAPAGPEAARRIERFILFNPISWLVASVWGQFEPLLMAFVLASYLAMRAQRWGRAGAWFAMAILVKPLAVFLLPIWILVAWERAGAPAVRRGALTAAGLGFAVCAPFLFFSPDGFLYQTIGMHLSRPPARFSIPNLVEPVTSWLLALLGHQPDAGLRLLGLLSLAATGGILAATFRAVRGRVHDEGRVLGMAGLGLIGALAVGKVLNEQYLFLPVVLLGVASAFPQQDRRVRHVLLATTIGASIAALVDGLAVLRFIAPDAWTAVAPGSTADAIAAIAASLGMTVGRLDAWTRGIAVAALLPAAWLLAQALRPHVDLSWLRPRSRPHAAVFATALLLIPTPLLAAPTAPEPVTVGHEDIDLLAYVRTDWHNPTHDPDVRAGSWLQTDERPKDGYYTVDWARARRDAQSLVEAGVDAVVLYADPAHDRNLKSWTLALDEVGLSFVVLWKPGTPEKQAVEPFAPLWHRTLYPRPTAAWAHDLDLDSMRAVTRLPTYNPAAGALDQFLAGAKDNVPSLIPWNDYGGQGAVEPASPHGGYQELVAATAAQPAVATEPASNDAAPQALVAVAPP